MTSGQPTNTITVTIEQAQGIVSEYHSETGDLDTGSAANEITSFVEVRDQGYRYVIVLYASRSEPYARIFIKRTTLATIFGIEKHIILDSLTALIRLRYPSQPRR